MLTRAQIQRLAQRHGIGAQAQECDYLKRSRLHTMKFKHPIAEFQGIILL
jgi:hypothetical protein